MGRYRKIDVRIWNDEKFSGLSDRGKLLFLFLLTHPHLTALGAMRATSEGLAAELKWEAKGFGIAFQEALSKGLFHFDKTASCVVIPNFLKYNPPESPNVIKSWGASIDMIPECKLKDALLQLVTSHIDTMGEGFQQAWKGFGIAFPIALSKGMPKGMPNQEQEQEQEHKQEQEHEQTKVTRAAFQIPTIDELEAYCLERKNAVEPKKFLAYYESNGWKVGKNQMKDWRAAVRTWENNNFDTKGKSNGPPRTGAGQLFDPNAAAKDPNHGVW